MKKINVAIIDDNINKSDFYEITKKNIHSLMVIDNKIFEDDKITENPWQSGHRINHGTICAAVFSEYSPDCRITGISVRQKENAEMNIDSVIFALQWAYDNDIDLIAMSIGTVALTNLHKMFGIIERLFEKGVILVCACSNENCFTYPASLPQVIGVRSDKTAILNAGQFSFVENPMDGINVTVSLPKMELSKRLCAKYNIHIGTSNSIAAPYIAAKICQYMEQGNDTFETIKNSLLKDGNTICYNFDYFKKTIRIFENMNEISVPVLGFVGNENTMYNFANKVADLFISEEYLCALIGNGINTDLLNNKFNISDISSIYANMNLVEIFVTIYNLCKPDVLLIFFTVDDIKNFGSLDSISILLSDFDKNDIGFPEDDEHMFISCDGDLADISLIYDRIKNVLS